MDLVCFSLRLFINYTADWREPAIRSTSYKSKCNNNELFHKGKAKKRGLTLRIYGSDNTVPMNGSCLRKVITTGKKSL